MVIEHADTTKLPDKVTPYKYDNVGKRWVSTITSSK